MPDESLSALTPEEIASFFPAVEPPPPPHRFEFGLVLGGTVSAAAYTAGVLDYLIQALDAWTEARDRNEDVPRHEVVLRIVTGSSGGGICAALLARILKYRFPHVTGATSSGSPQGDGNGAEGTRPSDNLLYDLWVNRVDAEDLFERSNDGDVRSLLNPATIYGQVGRALSYVQAEEVRRTWITDPFRCILTATNVTGVPYTFGFSLPTGTGASHVTYTRRDHAEYIRFATHGMGGVPHDMGERPDEFPLNHAAEYSWTTLGAAALATCALPAVLPPRAFTRPVGHYRYKVQVAPGEDGRPRILPLTPDWDQITKVGGGYPTKDTDQTRFLCLDGGAVDNQPLELCRTALAGQTGRNPRDPKRANRAIILVDPLIERDYRDKTPTLSKPGDPLSAAVADLGALAGWSIEGLMSQSRYGTADLLLAADPDVFSRFLIAPWRRVEDSANGIATGRTAAASVGMGGFLGFLCRDFRRHDFLLGRRNCRHFLEQEFVLHPEHPLFQDGRWTAAQRQIHATANGMLPIIPLVAELRQREPEEDAMGWPQGAFPEAKLNPGDMGKRKGPNDSLPAGFPSKVRMRVDQVSDKLGDDRIVPRHVWAPIRALVGGKAEKAIDDALAALILKEIKDNLIRSKLL